VVEPVKNMWGGIVDWIEQYVIDPLLRLFDFSWIDDLNFDWLDDMFDFSGLDDLFDFEDLFDFGWLEDLLDDLSDMFDFGWITDMGDWFGDNIIDPIKDAWEGFVNWIDDHFIEPVEDLWNNMLDSIGDWLEDWFGWIPGFGSYETGGYISKEGLYHLHAGETVVPAHQQGNTNNFTPSITVNANINSDIDINNLADRLSDIMYSNLTRRSNLGF